MSLQPNTRPKACAQCGTLFSPFSSTARVCSPTCARKIVKADQKAEKVQTRARKAELETIPELIKKAQHAFNAYIRERDRQAGYPCISSGRPLDWTGNAVDAGHYRSTGAASHLRFNEHNCHAQTKHDNQYLAGNAVDYRIGLVARIGVDAVETLEADNTPRKWTRDELREIRETYRTKLKQIQRETR